MPENSSRAVRLARWRAAVDREIGRLDRRVSVLERARWLAPTLAVVVVLAVAVWKVLSG